MGHCDQPSIRYSHSDRGIRTFGDDIMVATTSTANVTETLLMTLTISMPKHSWKTTRTAHAIIIWASSEVLTTCYRLSKKWWLCVLEDRWDLRQRWIFTHHEIMMDATLGEVDALYKTCRRQHEQSPMTWSKHHREEQGTIYFWSVLSLDLSYGWATVTLRLFFVNPHSSFHAARTM